MVNGMPWKILGLEREGASERDVKRAYARLLKKHRPEEDPEGFKRVHDAYQQALAELAWEQEESNHDIPPVPDPSRLFAEDFPFARPPAQAPVEIDIPEPDPDGPLPFGLPPLPFQEVLLDDDVVREPRAFDAAPHGPPDRTLQPPPPPPPRRIVPKNVEIDEVLADLERNDDSMPMRVLDAVLTKDLHNLRLKLGKAMIAEPARFANEASVRFATRLAMLLAFRNSHVAEGLMNMVFQIVPADQRNEVLAGPNFLLDIAPAFKTAINKGHWDFWCAAITNPERIDWDSKLAGFALGEADRLGYWEGYQLLDSVVPEEKQAWNRRAARGENINQVRHGRKLKTKESSGAWGYLFWILCIVLLTNGGRILDFFADNNNNNYSSNLPPRTTYLEPDWTKQDLGPVFVNAETQSSMEIKDGTVQIIGKRNTAGKKVYYVVLDDYVREFNAATLQTWQDKHRLTKSTTTATPRYRSKQMDHTTARQVEEVLRRNQERRDGLSPRPQIPSANPYRTVPGTGVPSNIRPPNPSIPSYPGMPRTRTPGNMYAPSTPRAPSRGPSPPRPFRSPSAPNTGW